MLEALRLLLSTGPEQRKTQESGKIYEAFKNIHSIIRMVGLAILPLLAQLANCRESSLIYSIKEFL